tara:strand:+ start:18343 stop:19674 length:1332 start_codon:yes stop_codon:yes gene_type:complete
MANTKISQFPQYSGLVNTDLYFLNNNSGETETTKIQLNQFQGLTQGDGANTIQSNTYFGDLGTTASTENSIAIGNGAEATSPRSIAIGYLAYNVNRDSGRNDYISIGTRAQSVQQGVALGLDANVQGQEGIAIGTDAAVYNNYATAINFQSRAYGEGSISIGKQATSSSSGGIAIGFETDSIGGGAIAMGFRTTLNGTYSASIAGEFNTLTSRNAVILGGLQNSITTTGDDYPFNNIFNGSGNTITSNSTNNTIVSGKDNTIYKGNNSSIISSTNTTLNIADVYSTSNVSMVGCKNTNITNSTNSVVLGVSGRTLTTQTNTTIVDKLLVLGNTTFEATTFNTAGDCVIDIFNMSHVIIDTTSVGAYNLVISPIPSSLGTPELTILIYLAAGSTITFDGSGSVQWKWGNGAGAPSLISGTRSIIKMSAWAGNDMWEISRSLNMV